jgi:hypothetical protein
MSSDNLEFPIHISSIPSSDTSIPPTFYLVSGSDNEQSSSNNESSNQIDFSSQHCLHTCTHHINNNAVVCSMILVKDCIQVVCYEFRTYKQFFGKISFVLVSSIILLSYNQQECWDAITKCIQFGDNGDNDMEINTNHIVFFRSIVNSLGNKSKILYLGKKKINDLEDWICQFSSEDTSPFTIEISVQMSEKNFRKYIYRIETNWLRDLFISCNLQFSKHKGKKEFDIVNDKSHLRNMFEFIMNGLVYDFDNDKILVREIELLKMRRYYNDNVNSKREKLLKNEFSESKMEEKMRESVEKSLQGMKDFYLYLYLY